MAVGGETVRIKFRVVHIYIVRVRKSFKEEDGT